MFPNTFPNSRLGLALLLAIAVATPACKKLDIKPQDETALTRGLRKKDADIDFGPGMTGDPILPENEYVNLPVTSTPQDWLKFKVQRFSEHDYALDPASIAVGGDSIARYSLLIRSAKGVDNVSHEGVRCVTGEWKMYATGRPDGTWARVPAPTWRRIDQTGLNAVRYTLFQEYVCDRDGVPFRDAQAIRKRIRDSNDGLLSKRRN